MVSKFKFGDMVSCKHYQTSGVIIGIDEASNAASIFIDGLNIPRYVHLDSLEIIKHPDTVRLDWLADKTNNMGSVLLPVECVEKHLDSLRDAIDAAMQFYNVKDENNDAV
nr:MAG TPA: Hemimethylated DNA-binding protein YccV like protein [Caudoviricetes sp.]DAU92907.1 MAG TPA: Hemimethylated DNA-binding protein YccV like protein [Caudoviricetes sp.]